MKLDGARVLVTGANGFLGRHLCAALERRGALVEQPAGWDLRDLRDVEITDGGRWGADVVFHLAARCGGIGANQRQPATFIRDNLLMGAHVLEAARCGFARKLVLVGTVCSYPKFTPTPFREADLWNGYPEETNAPYGVAKRALITMAQAFRTEYGCNFVSAIPANLYGPGDHFDLEASHVIPAMIRKFVEAKERGELEVTIWGDGTPTREFLYVEDAAEGLLRVAEDYDAPEPINLGTGVETSIAELATAIRLSIGSDAAIRWDATRPNGQPRRVLDVSRARTLLGFEATTPLPAGLTRTIDWYRANRSAT